MSEENRFGQIAVRRGFITADQLQRALEEQARSNLRIGDLLVQMGFMSQAQSTAIVKFQHLLESNSNPNELIGEIIGGCLVLKEMGCGPIGLTYHAHHLNLDREAVIKVLTKEALADPQIVERFRNEARAVARLHHPSIVGVYDFQDEEEFPYLVLEFVEGKSLRELLTEQGQLPLKGVVWAGLKLTTALAVAHSKDVIHRDLRPENVLISKGRDVKLTDFGLTRLAMPLKGASSSNSNMIQGRAQYIAPEQLRGSEDLDHRVDYYSLGILLFELLTGKLPYTQSEVSEYVRTQSPQPLPDILELCPECPMDLALIIQEMTEQNPNDRLVDLALITGRLHEITSQWASMPKIFPGVTKRLTREVLQGPEFALSDTAFIERILDRASYHSREEMFEQILSKDPEESSKLAMRIGEELWGQNRTDEIIELHAELQVAARDNENMQILIGLAYRKARRLPEALTALRVAFLMNRKNQKAGFELVRTLLAIGRREELPDVMRMILKEHPEDPVVLERAGEFYHMELGDDGLAMEAYKRALEYKEEQWPLLQRMGWIELERGEPNNSLEYLEQAARIAPEPSFSLKLLARAYKEMHRIQDAQDCLKRSLQLDPSDIDTRMGLIMTLKFQGQYDEVLKLCKQGLADRPGDLPLSLERAEALLLVGDHERAAKIFRRVLRKSPESDRAKTGLISAQRARQGSR
jgi:serine/threonine protein kinase/Flp pilus assembly protein TadD